MKEATTRKTIPCPDGREGCLVVHYADRQTTTSELGEILDTNKYTYALSKTDGLIHAN